MIGVRPLRGSAARPTRPQLACGLSLALVLAIYLGSITSTWYFSPDSALFLMLAENLAAGEGYTLWGQTHLHAPPGFPLMLAGMIRAGWGGIVWLNLSMALLTLATLWFVYAALKMQTSIVVARVVTLAVGVGHTMLLASIRILSDVPFMLLVWLGLYCYLRGLKRGRLWLEAGTAALVASCLLRVVGIPICLAAVVGLAGQPREVRTWRVWLQVFFVWGPFATVLALAAAGLRIFASFGRLPGYGALLNDAGGVTAWTWIARTAGHLVDAGEHLSRAFCGQPMPTWAALFVLWVPTLLGMGIELRRGQTLGAATAGAYLAAILIFRPTIARYLLPITPLLLWYFITGVGWLVSRRPSWRPYGLRVALGCAVVLAAINLPKVVRAVYWLRVPAAARSHDERAALEDAAAYLRQHASPEAIFVTSRDQRKLAFLSKLSSVSRSDQWFASTSVATKHLAAWKRRGLEYVVSHHRSLPTRDLKIQKACRLAGFTLVYQNDDFRIFSPERFGAGMHKLTSKKSADRDKQVH